MRILVFLSPPLCHCVGGGWTDDRAQPKPVIVPIILAPPRETHRVHFHRHLSHLLCVDGNETRSAVDQGVVDQAVTNAMYWQVAQEMREAQIHKFTNPMLLCIHRITWWNTSQRRYVSLGNYILLLSKSIRSYWREHHTLTDSQGIAV